MWARGATARGSDALPPAATPLRVAIDGRPLQPGFRKHAGRGIGVYARELVRALARRDDLALTLWFEPALPVPDGVVPPGVARRHYRPLRLPMRDRLASQITVPAAARGGADVFHVLAHGDAPSLPPACTVITVHDLILEVMAHHYPGNGSLRFRFARACERSAIRRAPMLVADSAATRDDLVRRHGVAPSRVHVAPLGVDACFRPPEPAAVEAFRAHHGLAAPFVLYVGGVDARKNIGLLLEAFALVRGGRAGPLELVLAGHVKGAAEYPALEARACELGIARSLRVLEFVPGEELPVLLAAARVFAFPSLYEGFGLPPLEAMACGTPVVSTDGGSLAEVLADAALVASATDPADFAAKLVTALDDEPLRAHLRARGLARAAMFTWDLTAEATVGAYRALVAARGARS